MASFNLTRSVRMKDGCAQLSLAPLEKEEVKVTMTPTTSEVVNKITTGEYTLYPTRVPLLGQHVSNMMNTIQRQLLLQPGQDGAWTEEAQRRLASLLAKPKVLVKTTPLPIEDKSPPSQEIPGCKRKRAQLSTWQPKWLKSS